jgi:hypothetical protein
MSREIRHSNKKQSAHKGSRRKHEPSAYTSKIIKTPTKQQLETQLRHAVRNADTDAFEDYDDWGENV